MATRVADKEMRKCTRASKNPLDRTRARKLKKHRVNMVEFRLKKKEEHNLLRCEHGYLEQVLKSYLSSISNDSFRLNQAGMDWHRLIVEAEALRKEREMLSQKRKRHEAFRELLARGYSLNFEHGGPNLPMGDGDTGRWVHFPDGSPSFYYSPISTKDADATADSLCPGFATDLPTPATAGNFLGWKVHRVLVKLQATRVRFTKRVRSSIDLAYKVACEREADLRPLLVTPVEWGFKNRQNVSTQVLQEMDPGCRVMVHNVPGSTPTRYVFLARVAQWELQDGKRRAGFSMVITDFKAHRLSRDASAFNEKVSWATEGWASFTLTEVDGDSVDVVYEHYAGCESESHAGLLMAQWAQFIVRWEQTVVPSTALLSPGHDAEE